MAKRQSFADKASKKAHETVCPTCNQVLEWVKIVDPLYVAETRAWKFKDKIIGLCKCNEKEILA